MRYFNSLVGTEFVRSFGAALPGGLIP